LIAVRIFKGGLLTIKNLIVAVRGWTNADDILLAGRPSGEFPAGTLQTLQAGLPHSEVWAPKLNLAMFSMDDAETIAQGLFNEIHAKVGGMPELEAIVLLGYSAGSLLVRRVFCIAHGANLDGSVEEEKAVYWASLIHRVVILAGITRGWEYSTASPPSVRFFSPVLFGLARLVGWWKSFNLRRLPFIFQLKRGAPFVISARIQYIKVMQKLRERREAQPGHSLRAGGLPSTIFLLGAKDEYISPADCTELGPRAEFAYAELRGSNHIQVLQIAGRDNLSRLRRLRVLSALRTDFAKLRKKPWVLPPDDIDDYSDPMDLAESSSEGSADGDRVEHAVLVVHGIRDNGFWTKRVSREIKTQARRGMIVVRAPSPTYGFFSMWDFIRPNGRKNATYWFMERYADVQSHFPKAKISFVGHSNGTYIATHAMALCQAIRFERIVLAGSVVRRDYSWALRAQQVKGVLNYVGVVDSVVAFLPAAFEAIGLKGLDVGGAGAFGFKDASPPPAVRKAVPPDAKEQVELTEVRYVRGGHGGAISEDFWPEIAAFVLYNRIPEYDRVIREWPVKALFASAPLITAIGLTLAVVMLALPLLAGASIALIAIVGVEQNMGWLTQAINHHRTLWSIAAVGTILGSIGASTLFSRFLRAW
jgi:pimeloyl-ACP methyl ester carboxylesterase